jgi:hypothetical protein
MIFVAGPPGGGKSSALSIKQLGIDWFNADDRAAELNAGSYHKISSAIRETVGQGARTIHPKPHRRSARFSVRDDPAKRRTGDDSYHKLGPREFGEVHHLNIPAIVARLSAKPFIRVESGAFVGRCGDEEYESRIHGGRAGSGDSQDARTPVGDPD